MQQKKPFEKKVEIILHQVNLDAEALASSQWVRSLTTALLNEVRASVSVGGGGRKGRTGGEITGVSG